MGRGLAQRAAIVQHPGRGGRPTGAGVLSAAVAVAAEGSHATRTDPAHAAPHACARTAHACATAALRSPAAPCHPVSPLGSCPCPPSSWMQTGLMLAPSTPSAPHDPNTEHQALPTSAGMNTCDRGRCGLPTWTPNAVAVGGLAEGAGHSRSCLGTGTACPSPPSLTQSWSQGSSRSHQAVLEVLGGPKASLAHGPVLAPTPHSPRAPEPHTHTRPPAAPPVGSHCLCGAAPPAGPCTLVDTHARNTRVQVVTHRYLHPHPSTGLLLGVHGVTFLQSPTCM